MKKQEKLIITAAVTGSRNTRDQTPYIPITPEEISQSCIDCWKAGAAIVHVHVRDLKTKFGTQDIDLFKRTLDPIREKTDLVVCFTTSGIAGQNLPFEKRLEPLDLGPELASLDAGSINLAGNVFSNPPEFLDLAASVMRKKNVKPEIEIFDLGMLITALNMRAAGKLDDPIYCQFVLGTPHGAPATAKSLLHLYEHLPSNSIWSVTGIGKGHLPVSMIGLVLGGHIRVGMEDNLYYRRGELAKTNAMFVERIVRIASEYGRDVACPNEARNILGLKKG